MEREPPRVERVGRDVFAFVQPPGSWGYSNAGLVVGATSTLLVDTMFDLEHTRAMLAALREASPRAEEVDVVVNTHANGDHWHGNVLVPGAEVVASTNAAAEMSALPPAILGMLMAQAPQLGRVGEFLTWAFGDFRFDGIEPAYPTRTFDGETTIDVGGCPVRLLEVGPAHTAGDVIVHLPEDGVVFTGDILFVGGHPVVWAGPVGNWIRALDLILSLEAATIVPGHGPVTDRASVSRLRDYFVFLQDEARRRFDAGQPALDAAAEIPLGEFASWTERERMAANIGAMYREFAGESSPAEPTQVLAAMAELRARLGEGS